jgi:hypothetical protein
MASNSVATVADAEAKSRLAELVAENERLRREVEQLERDNAIPRSSIQPAAFLRSLGAVVFITLGAILAPSAIVASWAATEITDTDRFLASLAPLSHDPQVREFVADSVAQAIENNVDIDGFTAEAFSGISANLEPPASLAVAALAPAAADGLRQLLDDAVHRVVQSDAFQVVWDESLRLGHTELVAILENDTSAAVVVNGRGEIGINLEPIVAKVKAQLQAADFPLADRIPPVTATVTVGTIDNIGQVRAAYRALLFSASALPWVSLGLLILGILLARSRARGVLGGGIGIVLSVGGMLLALQVGRGLLSDTAAQYGAPPGVTETIVDALTAQVRGAGLALVLIGALLAIAGFLRGRAPEAAAIREASRMWVVGARESLDRRGLAAPRVGAFLSRARFAIWTAIAVIVFVILVISRPLTPATVITTTLCVAVVAILYAVLERPVRVQPDA